MSKIQLHTFFASKTLTIPSYQRDYAWVQANIDDLFEDVHEALETGGGHYLGTFILSQAGPTAEAQVVDGQQRLTTLTLLLDALIDRLEDERIKQHYRNMFIENPVDGPKLRMKGNNASFFHDLLGGRQPAAETDGQERLIRAHGWIRQRVDSLVRQNGATIILDWLKCLASMEVLEFIEPDEGKAIRMFQSVNDRGVPLSRMDIVKSLLVYFSNRYLGGGLDQKISEAFGLAFRSFSKTTRLASRDDGFKIRHMAREQFREDDVLRYHYMAFDAKLFDASAGADYNATSETVLSSFLKPTLKRLRTEPDRLRAFIESYINDLANFFAGLEQLTEATRSQISHFKLFVIQDLSATLYPLVIRLHLMGWLSKGSSSKNLLELIEMVDLRVFKLRGTNPQADIASITQELPMLSIEQLEVKLRSFAQKFMSDPLMLSRMAEEDLYRNPGVQRILIEVEEQARAEVAINPLDLYDLVRLNAAGLTVEHILPQEPSYNIKAYGFDDDAQYSQNIHRIGNLVMLEGEINSTCRNRTIEEKMTNPYFYARSGLQEIEHLRADSISCSPMFSREAIEIRSNLLARMMVERWPIS